jgi:hypothetical protein
MTIRNSALALSFSTLCLAVVSCSGEDASNKSSGGGSGMGGTTTTGGAGVGGTPTMGGSTNTGGSTSTGGAGMGGSTSAGTTNMAGTTSMAGTTTAGGTTNMAGTTSMAGTMAAGGTTSMAGSTSTGGTMTAGGTTSAGGVGGTSAAGGSVSGGAGGSGGTGEPEVHIYLALGQSNMQGAAHVPDEAVFHDRVQVLQGQNCPASDGHDYGYGEWREMFTPMIRCYEGTRDYPGASGPIGLGPADSFAVTMAEAAGPNVTIGIVGAAYGGTDIQAHLPNCASFCKPPYGDVSGAPVVNGTTPIYQWIKDLATKAQAVGTIKGIIFHHGENNSGQQSWLTHTQTYIDSLRTDLGLDPAEVPFVAGELPRTGCCASHNSLVQQIPDYVENGHWVSSGPMEDGTVLGDRGDSLHWSTFSVIEMGKRYAAKMLEAQGK